ncbi:DUF6082 family protein [Streptomyces sp. NBC_01239]|uniref:DUF6082 family protein n=1 Tax=Streptomyces sp. NBC_01239 TaxID=2903792 RepID=UPI0022501762|nr:DUF6082 family protein [Streptomyces sp. NBC_01239]MCX4814399.1 DUF6082 family protein [Streptomyces sp. NBC_01239]
MATQRQIRRSILVVSSWAAAATAGTALVGAASVVVSGWLVSGVEKANGDRRTALDRSSMGDYFGGASAVFSGLALILLVVTVLFQQHELRLQRQELGLQREELISSRNELRRSAEADLRSLHVQLTQMQMADPALAEVWNDYPEESPRTLRQNLFANLTFSHYLLVFRWGGITENEMLAHAQRLVSSPVFNRYWDSSRSAKEALPPDSAEGRLFRIFEQAIQEARHRGTPPTP